MSFTTKFGNKPASISEDSLDPELQQALKNFRSSVHAWTDAEYGRARMATTTATNIGRRPSWRLAVGWALGCLLAAGGFSGGLYQYHQRQELAKVAATRAADHEQQVRQVALDAHAQQAGASQEDFLADVDSDVSQEVPSAMEPLAHLMAGDDVN